MVCGGRITGGVGREGGGIGRAGRDRVVAEQGKGSPAHVPSLPSSPPSHQAPGFNEMQCARFSPCRCPRQRFLKMPTSAAPPLRAPPARARRKTPVCAFSRRVPNETERRALCRPRHARAYSRRDEVLRTMLMRHMRERSAAAKR